MNTRRKPRAIAIARTDDRRDRVQRLYLLTVLAGVTLAAVAMLVTG